MSQTWDKMSEELQGMVDNMTLTQRLYCEYRAKNLTAKESARKAGSQASEDRLKNVGYALEQMVGSKEYIDWLRQQSIKYAIVDASEILEKLRRVFNKAYDLDKLKEANESAKLMGMMIGLFGVKDPVNKKEDTQREEEKKSKALEAFTEGEEDNETNDRIKQLQSMLKELNKSK